MTAIPERPRLRPRFKAIEHFLRRVAFNLGNTPSQTEVKVISCVPIDVTDLQNRIIELENALDQEHEEIVATAIGAPTFQPGAKLVEHNPNPSISSRSPSSEQDRNSRNRNRQRFRKHPKISSKTNRRENVQLMYYAQTSNNFLNAKHSERKQKEGAAESSVSHVDWDDVERQQYAPLETSSSHFSWPVCRDEPSRNTELCSCYQPRTRYHDLDARTAVNAMPPYPADPQWREYSPYYDSSLYDLVPVRDTTTVSSDQIQGTFYRKSIVKLHRSPGKRQKPWRTKASRVVNAKHSRAQIGHKLRYKMTASKLALKREKVLRAMQRRGMDRLSVAEESQASTECSDKTVQVKVSRRQPSPPSAPFSTASSAPVRPKVILKNAECLTTPVQDSMCQTVTNRSVQLDTNNDTTKTEITLDQIKSIMYTVLEEIKTNSQHFAEDRVKKDANVQKSSSTNNIGDIPNNGSGPFTARASMANNLYNPNPMSAYSPFTGECGLLSGPYGRKMLQQYPVFVCAPQRCSYCYRTIPRYIPCNSKTKPAPSKSPPHTYKRETDNLIKEIYKSLSRRTSSNGNVSDDKIKPKISILTPPKSAESNPRGTKAKREEHTQQDPNQQSYSKEIMTVQKDALVQAGNQDNRSNELVRFLLEPQETRPKDDISSSACQVSLEDGQTDGRTGTDESETKGKKGLFGMMKQLVSSKNRRRRRDTFATQRRNTHFPLSVYTFLCRDS